MAIVLGIFSGYVSVQKYASEAKVHLVLGFFGSQMLSKKQTPRQKKNAVDSGSVSVYPFPLMYRSRINVSFMYC